MINGTTTSGYCCGVREIGNFNGDYHHLAHGSTPEGFLRSIVDQADDEEGVDGGFVYHVWFVKRCNYDGAFTEASVYEQNELRLYVQTLPGVIALGEHINPNTGNMIDGYFFKDPYA